MPSQVTCRGLLLRSFDYSDTSRIFRFLTPDRGIVSLMGRGVRGRSARGEAPIQTFGEGSLTFSYQVGRDLHTMKEFHSEKSAGGLARDLMRFAGASLVAELLLAHAVLEGGGAPEAGDPALYDWVSRAVRMLGEVEAAEVPGWIVAGGWRTLAHLGFPPETERCVHCAGELAESPALADRFDVQGGGLVCPHCGEGTSLPRVGPGARADLRELVRGSPPGVLRGSPQHLAILEGFALHHLSPRSGFRSFEVVRSLLGTPSGPLDGPSA
jgi:DNA repair protein RecO (recombination protein O)